MMQPIEGALVLHVVIAIENENVHEQHFWIRDATTLGMRSLDKYLEHLGDIRHIQDFIVNEAARSGVPVIQNGSIEQAIRTVMELVLERAAALERAQV
jgi:2-phosphoglycerate kinase